MPGRISKDHLGGWAGVIAGRGSEHKIDWKIHNPAWHPYPIPTKSHACREKKNGLEKNTELGEQANKRVSRAIVIVIRHLS